jgi:hypothetical protein
LASHSHRRSDASPYFNTNTTAQTKNATKSAEQQAEGTPQILSTLFSYFPLKKGQFLENLTPVGSQ